MIETVRETGSTNADLAARIAHSGYVAEGAWLLADRQTAGRGRLGRSWSDGAGNFMGSTVVHLRHGDPSPDTLALVAGLAVYEAVVSRAGPETMLKWPNDVLVDGAKLAGILLERIGDAVVIGIGVNLAAAPRFDDRLLALDAAAADQWGRIVARSQAAGRPIGAMDAFLAALATLHQLTLVTRNVADFEGTGIRLFNPWSRRDT